MPSILLACMGKSRYQLLGNVTVQGVCKGTGLIYSTPMKVMDFPTYIMKEEYALIIQWLLVRIPITTGRLSCLRGILLTVIERSARDGHVIIDRCVSLAAECVSTCCPGDCSAYCFEDFCTQTSRVEIRCGFREVGGTWGVSPLPVRLHRCIEMYRHAFCSRTRKINGLLLLCMYICMP